jgi:multicomponent Na+:H+ antiporter subunit D
VSSNLPALQVILPLMAAPVCVLLRHHLASRIFALAISWTSLCVSWAILGEVQVQGVISYELGGFPPPMGIELRIDHGNAFILMIVSLIGAVVMTLGKALDEISLPQERHYLFYAAYLLCLCGLLGITVTGDAFNVFVFLEVTSLASYTLISMGKTRRAVRAAFSYLIMGTIGGTFILIGIGLMYQMTGTLNMADLAVRLQALEPNRTMVVAFAFLGVGTAIKLAVFPLHQWLPNAYAYAPAMVSAFLAATATKVSYYVLVRVIFTIFGAAYVFGTLGFDMVLLPVSILAMFIGSTAAIFQTDLKRLLAYSSIAQIGYMTLGLSMNSHYGLSGGLVHLFNHALMKGGLFLVVACVVYRISSSKIEDYRGLGRRMPLTMAAFVIGGLSLIGVPGTVGFVSKWYLVVGALQKGWLIVAVLILLSSLLAVVYIWKVVELAYLQKPAEGAGPCEAPLSMLIPTWILIWGTVYFGLDTTLTAQVAETAAAQLMGLGGLP